MPRPSLSRLIRATGVACLLLAGSSLTAWAAPQSGRQAKPPAQGQHADETRNARAHDRRDSQRALAEAVGRAERASRGQVLSAERVQYDGRDLNRVKLVDDRGRVRVYWDDPADAGGRRRGSEAGDNAPRTRDDDDRSD